MSSIYVTIRHTSIKDLRKLFEIIFLKYNKAQGDNSERTSFRESQLKNANSENTDYSKSLIDCQFDLGYVQPGLHARAGPRDEAGHSLGQEVLRHGRRHQC